MYPKLGCPYDITNIPPFLTRHNLIFNILAHVFNEIRNFLLMYIHIAFVKFILFSKQNRQVILSQVVVTLHHSNCRPAELRMAQADTSLDLVG
jgi:hypothetical protein